MKKKYIIFTIIVIILFIIFTVLGIKKSKYNKMNENVQNMYNQMKDDSVMYNENSSLEDLKKEYSITGEDSLYEVQTEYDGRKALIVKADINFKVAFAGLIKKEQPVYSEIDKIFENNYPLNNGIWIEESSRAKIQKFLNENLNSKYEIDGEGYLKIIEKNQQSENDIYLEKLIKGNKKYILNISSICYMVDAVTGNIIENPYDDFGEYQTYEYFSMEDNMIIFITENSANKLTEKEIFESVLELISLEL